MKGLILASLFFGITLNAAGDLLLKEENISTPTLNATLPTARDGSNLQFPEDKELTLGYIALVENTLITSNIIKAGTLSKWSHVAMILCNRSDISEKPFGIDKTNWYCFEANTQLDNNVHLFNWEKFNLNEKAAAKLVLRPMLYNEKAPEANILKQVVNRYLGRPYETILSELALAPFRVNSAENANSIFCSELVALTLQDLGFLDAKNRLSNNYVPADFSLERPHALKLNGVSLGKETILESKTGIFRYFFEYLWNFILFIPRRLNIF